METTQRRATIYDVARQAGVATSTVSRALARPGRVNAETADKVRRVADELGYQPRRAAQPPAEAPSTLLAALVADIANPYFAQLVRGAQIAAASSGYEILLVDARESAVRERASLHRLVPIVAGFLVAGSRMPDGELRAISLRRPLVMANRELGGVPSVVADNAGGMRAAIELLARLGHRAATYVSGPEASWTDAIRYRAFQEAGRAMGLQVQRAGPFLPTFDGGLTAAAQLAPRTPGAVVAFNDLVATGLMHGLARAGLSVPDDVSVIGFDDILSSRLTTPPLTTLAPPIRQIGSTAANNLIGQIGGAQPGGGTVVLPMLLRVRGSTGPAADRR